MSDESYSGGFVVPLFAVISSFGFYFFRRYMKGAQFNEYVKGSKGKIALVTGASAGIGKQTARELNLRGLIVFMLCRGHQKAESTKIELTKLGCDPTRLIIKDVDLANFATIRKFSADISKEVDHIDILVNNAGIMFYPKFELTVDGYELTWQSNYLGHFLLTELLLPLLKNSPQGRIVNVSSALHKKGDSIDASVISDKKKFNNFLPYCRSKLANVMHARELTRRIRLSDPQSTLTINSLHPGVCFTELMRHSIFCKTPIYQVITPFLWFFMKTEKDGCQTTIFLALSKSVETISGRYFGECRENSVAPEALNDNTCRILYNQSLQAVGLAK